MTKNLGADESVWT